MYKQKRKRFEKSKQVSRQASSVGRSRYTPGPENTSTTPLSSTMGKELKTSAVLFVENTKDGALARKLRELVERIQYILGFRIKIVERAGTPLKMMFPLSRIGQGRECGRYDCVTCTQVKLTYSNQSKNLPPSGFLSRVVDVGLFSGVIHKEMSNLNLKTYSLKVEFL